MSNAAASGPAAEDATRPAGAGGDPLPEAISRRLQGLPAVRVEGAALRTVELPLVSPFTTSFGTQTVRHALLLELWGEGLHAWGECVAETVPAYSAETLFTAREMLRRHLLPPVVGAPARPVAEHLAGSAWVRGHQMARMTLEMALLDLAGQAGGRSLGQILGATTDRVRCGVSIGIQPSLAATITLIEGYLAEGYQRIKLKCRPGYDLALARAVRERFPDCPVMLDANSAYSLRDLETLRQLDAYDLMMIEQPLATDDFVDHAALQAAIRTPVCLDESVHSLAAAHTAVALQAGRIVNLKPGRVGGFLVAAAIHDVCQAHGWPTWVGGMLETGLGRAANVALAGLPNNTLPGDTSASDRYFHADLIPEPFRLAPDGTLPVPTGPGLGVAPDPRRLQETTLEYEVVR